MSPEWPWITLPIGHVALSLQIPHLLNGGYTSVEERIRAPHSTRGNTLQKGASLLPLCPAPLRSAPLLGATNSCVDELCIRSLVLLSSSFWASLCLPSPSTWQILQIAEGLALRKIFKYLLWMGLTVFTVLRLRFMLGTMQVFFFLQLELYYRFEMYQGHDPFQL